MDWYELRDRLSALPALEHKMEQLLGQIWEAKGGVDALLKKYEQERINTQRIKKESFSTTLLKLTGRYEDRLEKEQRDEIAAKLEYDQAVNNLSYLRGEQQELGERIAALKQDEETFQAELSKRRKTLSANAASEFAALSKEHDEIIIRMTEVKETLVTASRVHTSAQKAMKCMQNVNSWASVDTAQTKGSGMISHIAKYDHLDTAEENVNTLKSQLAVLKTELARIRDFNPPELASIKNISGKNIVDFLPSPAEIKAIIEDVDKLQPALELELHELNKALEQNRRREEEIVLK
ncbi:MAG: hypothetical protein FWB96_04000 [Defluviitaleaceae bacterium]|nr:hypothetical protein [Defluviitaleaceae bacterium]MCL2262077.1 hypothetical protein [Defluviitaleaceae bacterium]